MSAFKSELLTRDRSNEPPQKIRFELTAPLIYQSDLLKTTLTVPIGFVTDFASIPQPLWNVLPPVGGYDEAAVVHDYLFATQPCSWHTANGVLKEAMKVLHCRWDKILLIYAGVMTPFGYLAWKHDQRHG